MITKEQIAIWKKEHKDVFVISVEGKKCYLKKPSRKTLGYASVAGKDNPIKFNEVILRDCWLGGDEELRSNDEYFLAVSGKIADIIEVKEAEMEKL